MSHPSNPSAPETPPPTPPKRRRRWRRIPKRLLALAVAIVAGVFVTFFTYDLGPELRQRAEREGSNYLRRPMHIGKLSARLVPGVFVVEDVVIEGLEPSHRPVLTAKKITVEFPWWSVFRRTSQGKRPDSTT